MDIGRAFTFVTEDPKWVVKVLIGGALMLVNLVLSFGISVVFNLVNLGFLGPLVSTLLTAPILMLLLGYTIQVARNVIAGTAQALPEWANWELLGRDGVKAWVVQTLLYLPVLVVSMFSSLFARTGNAGGGLVALCLSCLVFLLAIGLGLLYPVALGRFAATGDVARALNVGALVATFRRQPGTYLLTALVSFAAVLVGSLGVILCGIGLPFTLFYAFLVVYHLIGQAYRQTEGGFTAYGQPQQPTPSSYPF